MKRRHILAGMGVALAALGGGVAPAQATAVRGDASEPLEIPEYEGELHATVERFTDVRQRVPNNVPIKIVVVDAATKQPPPPKVDFLVRAWATDTAGLRTDIHECRELAGADIKYPHGEYECTVIVDHGGVWTFHAAVNELPAGPNVVPKTLTEATTDLAIDAPALAGEAPDPNEVTASATEVALLQTHMTLTVLWFICAAALMMLAIPALRRRLSTGTLHRLEERVGLFARLGIGLTVAVWLTGLLLLRYMSAYEPPAPWSTDRVDAVFALPYGRPYFVTMWTKISLYTVMCAAMIPVVREARRRTVMMNGRAAATPRPSSASPWTTGIGAVRAAMAGQPVPSPVRPTAPVAGEAAGRTATLVDERAEPVGEEASEPNRTEVLPASAGRTRVAAPAGALVVLIGGAGISLCVTLLKYFHELIEASSFTP